MSSVNNNNVSTDPSDYSNMDRTSSFLSILNNNMNTFITQQTLINNYPIVTQQPKISKHNDKSVQTNNVTQQSQNMDITMHKQIQKEPLRRSKRKRKTITYNDNSGANNFVRSELETLSLDELLANAMSCIPNLRWNRDNEWCRYCGSRGSPTFTYSPWGKKKLCYIHHVMWKRNELCLTFFDEPNSIDSPINKADCTEKTYLINVLMECNETNEINEINNQIHDNHNSKKKRKKEKKNNGSDYEYDVDLNEQHSDDNMYLKYTVKDSKKCQQTKQQTNIHNKLIRLANVLTPNVTPNQFTPFNPFNYNNMKPNVLSSNPMTITESAPPKQPIYNKKNFNEHMSEESEQESGLSTSTSSESMSNESESENSHTTKNKVYPILGKIMPILPPDVNTVNIVHDKKKKQNKIRMKARLRKYKNSNKRKHKCEQCNESFGSKRGLKDHIGNIHTQESTFICNPCNQGFATKKHLKNHIHNKHTTKERKNKAYQCKYCSYSSTSRNTIEKHENIHVEEKPFKCGKCGKRFKLLSYLHGHMDRVHVAEQDKKYECNVCQKRFSSKQQLKKHILIHSTFKPYKCYQCEYASQFKDRLDRHIKVHTGEKPHICKYCNKAFRLKSYVSTHEQKMHSNEISLFKLSASKLSLSAKPKDKYCPKKPLTSYFLYAQYMRGLIKQDNPRMNMTEVSKITGKKWKALNDEEKKQYKEEADKLYQEYKIKLNEYKKTSKHKKHKKRVKKWEIECRKKRDKQLKKLKKARQNCNNHDSHSDSDSNYDSSSSSDAND